MRKEPIATSLVVVLFAGFASAQPAGAPPAPKTTAPSVDDAIPRSTDAMLSPVPAARRTLTSWDEALSLAQSRSADYGIALDEVERAEGQSRVALAGALPTLNGSASATHQFITSTTTTTTTGTAGSNSLQASLTLSVPLVAAETWYAVGTARANARAVALSLEDQKRQIVLAVIEAMLAEAAAERVSEIDRVGLSDALARLAIVEKKQELGAGSALDLLRARQDVLSARAALVRGDEALLETREALGLALGLSEPVSLGSGLDVPALEAGVLRACSPGSADDRPDIRAARARLEVAQRGVTDVDLKFLPTVTASSTASVTAVDQGTSPRGSWNIQAVLNWPIWDGGVRYGLRREAKASASEAQRSLDALGRSASVDVQKSTRGVSVAAQSAELSTATRDSAAELDRLTRISYEEGGGTGLDLISAATALRQAQINVTVDEFNTARARIEAALAKSTCKL